VDVQDYSGFDIGDTKKFESKMNSGFDMNDDIPLNTEFMSTGKMDESPF
jgi:hypothetical protein